MALHVTFTPAPVAYARARYKEQSKRDKSNASGFWMRFFFDMDKIGSLQFDKKVFLAPMAGVGDFAMRSICKKFGAGLVYGEMASAIGIVMGTDDSRKLVNLPDIHPFAVQLFGKDPKYFSEAAKIICEYKPDIIDINMGCPAPKVTNNGSGSALLNNLPLAYEIICRTVDAAKDIPVTVKMRKGFGMNEDVIDEAAPLFEKAGVSAITLHARTRAQMYAPSADWSSIKKLKSLVKVPVIGNGDVTNLTDAKKMMEETGCDFVMIGRAAMGHPWIFKEGYNPSLEERFDIFREEMKIRVKDRGPYLAFREGRKHLMSYISGIRGAASLRAQAGHIENFEDIEKIISQALLLE